MTSDQSRHPTPTPENGKAMIDVVPRATGAFKFGVDGKWLGALKNGTYFYARVDPGEHHLCVKANFVTALCLRQLAPGDSGGQHRDYTQERTYLVKPACSAGTLQSRLGVDHTVCTSELLKAHCTVASFRVAESAKAAALAPCDVATES